MGIASALRSSSLGATSRLQPSYEMTTDCLVPEVTVTVIFATPAADRVLPQENRGCTLRLQNSF